MNAQCHIGASTSYRPHSPLFGPHFPSAQKESTNSMLTAGNGNLTFTMFSSSFSSYAKDLDPSCTICYNPFSTTTTMESESPVQIACGHILGEKCLAKWLSASSTCPICRQRPQGCETAKIHDSRSHDLQWNDAVEYGWLEADSTDQAETGSTNAARDVEEAPPFVTSQDNLWNQVSDLWLTYVYDEQVTPCRSDFPTLNRSLIPYELESDVEVLDNCYDKLTECHEEWMAEIFNDCETNDDEEVRFYDVYPY